MFANDPIINQEQSSSSYQNDDYQLTSAPTTITPHVNVTPDTSFPMFQYSDTSQQQQQKTDKSRSASAMEERKRIRAKRKTHNDQQQDLPILENQQLPTGNPSSSTTIKYSSPSPSSSDNTIQRPISPTKTITEEALNMDLALASFKKQIKKEKKKSAKKKLVNKTQPIELLPSTALETNSNNTTITNNIIDNNGNNLQLVDVTNSNNKNPTSEKKQKERKKKEKKPKEKKNGKQNPSLPIVEGQQEGTQISNNIEPESLSSLPIAKPTRIREKKKFKNQVTQSSTTENGANVKINNEKVPKTKPKRAQLLPLQKGQTKPNNEQLLPIPKAMDSLPIHEFSSSIIEAIEENQVTVITGFTGCGKSTQLPQIILKHYIENSNTHRLKKIKIVCTQPRRLAATSLARRVNNEMKSYLNKNGLNNLFKGRVSGHIIGGEAVVDNNTPIVYATEGCLTQIIMGMHSSSTSSYENFHNEFSHIVLDEIHERKVDTDLLLYFVREIVKVNPKIRIILMSATLSQEKICKYFESYLNMPSEENNNGVDNEENEEDELFISNIVKTVPSIHIPSGCYPVVENHIEDVIQILYNSSSNPLTEEELLNRPQFAPLLSKPLRSSIKPERRILGARLIEYLHTHYPLNQSILVFLPGMMEIEDFSDDLTANFIGGASAVDCPYDIHILHSLIAEQEQEESLLPPKEGKRKVILSTNIAESSITVPDVVIVIDFCLCKGKFWNENFNAEVMGLDWISKDSAKQRKGRAGRVSPGVLYRMITRDEFEMLDDSVVPEIQRKPLSSVVLQILMFNGAYIEDPTQFKGLPKNYKTPSDVLQKCLDPPNQSLLEQAYYQLESLGAIVKHVIGNDANDSKSSSVFNQYELDEAYLVTTTGKFFSLIPTELNAAYLLLVGYSLNLLPECIIIVSILSRSVPILVFSSLKLLSARASYSFDNGSESDLIAGFNAYNTFKKLQTMKREHKITPQEFTSQLARQMLALKKMIEIDSLVVQISQSLYKHYGIFIENLTPNTLHSKHETKVIGYSTDTLLSTEKMNIIKSLIATLFYEQAVKGTIKKEHKSLKEIECSLQTRDQTLSLSNTDEMQKVFSELFYKFDGGVVDCTKIKIQSEKKINITYSLPVSDTSFVLPLTEVQKKDPLFPLKLLQRMIKGSSESKEKKNQTLEYTQVRQSMLAVRDDDQIYGIFRGLPGDLVKSHGLKFKSISSAFDRKISFIHPQAEKMSKQRIIISRDSVSHPWVDLTVPEKILISGSVSIKDMTMLLDKNTTLPDIEYFYEMSLILFLPLIYPRRFLLFKPNYGEQTFFLISELFEKMKPHEKTEFIQHKINSDLNLVYLISSGVKNFDMFLPILRGSIQKKITELLSCQPVVDTQQISTQITDLLNNAKNYLSHKGYNRNISKIVSVLPADDEEEVVGGDDESCGDHILRTTSFQRISQRILNLLAKQCLLSPDDPPVEIRKKGKTTLEISCSYDYQYLQAKYLLLREINNDYAVFAHPKQAFVCLEVGKDNLKTFLSSMVYFSNYEDKSGKNREFYTINRIPATKLLNVNIDEVKESNEVRKGFNTKMKSDKLTNGGFLLQPFTTKAAADAFREKIPANTTNDEYMQVYAYFGKQVFYQSKAGATKIHSQQKGLAFNTLRKMKIGNDNDVKTLFLHFIDARRQPDSSLISNLLTSKNGKIKESVFSNNHYFKTILANKDPVLGKQKEYISLNIVDMDKRERFTILLYLDREQTYTDENTCLVKCSMQSWRRSDTKLIYLDYVSPIQVHANDDPETISRKNENTLDVRFSKVTHSRTIKNGFRDLIPTSIQELESRLWYNESNFTLYYCYDKDDSVLFANLNDLNLSFGSTLESDELCKLRANTPLARLSIDSIHYDIKENLHLDDLKIQFKNRTDISHPTLRKSFTTLRVCHSQLQTALDSRLQKQKIKEFMKLVLYWKDLMNESSLKNLD